MELVKHLNYNDMESLASNVEMGQVYLAQDIGSTQTRTMMFEMDGTLSDILKMDSNYYTVRRDISHINARSKEILAQLEMVITDLTAEGKSNPLFTSVRIVKGPLVDVINAPTNRTTANSSKIDQLPTYINCLSNIAIILLLKSVDMGGISSQPVKVDLTVSLPPEDTSTPVRMQVFNERMCGSYQVEFPRLGCVIRFELGSDHLHVFSESNAVAIAQQATNPIGSEDTVGFIDVGGRSTGFSFVHNGILLEDSCVTESIGGQRLKDLIAQRVSNMLNTQLPSDEVIMRALASGEVRIGSKYMDISAEITEAKREIAEQIFNAFMLALDSNNLQSQQLGKVFCSGRTFGSSTKDGYETSPSMVVMLEEMFRERTPFVDFALVDVDDPIITGLVYGRFMIV